jgi:hypothetical protein
MTIKKIPSNVEMKDKAYSIPTLHLPVPVDFEPADIMVPGAWAHVAPKVRVGYEIIARRVDLAWRVHLQVVEVGIGFVRVQPLAVWANPDHKPAVVEDETQPLPDLPDNYKVGWVPGNRTYSVRTSDPNEQVSAGHKTKLAAHMAAIQHAQKVLGQAA